MIFFSGFGFANEQTLFANWLDSARFTVAGFSMGAIDAIEHALITKDRIDKIILFSPAYFCGVDNSKKSQEIETFKNHPDIWFKLFYAKCGVAKDLRCTANATVENLEKLLFYDWDIHRLELLINKGIALDVYFGENDSIINLAGAKSYFGQIARQMILIKNTKHSLG